MNEWMSNARRAIKSSLWTTFPIVIIAFSIPLIAYFGKCILPDGESVASWFQRSGSIVVALAVWIEIKNNKISGYIYPSGLSTSDYTTLRNDYGAYFNAIKWSGFVLAVIGTLIWGYGDIPIRNT
ncbi:hypothetical protein [Microbulbifer sp. ANSA005]|uniref:hypothetical protein n=1 Tax=Microbulbifer sp. ANSA005 TaxID=3243362 RepID=UPI004041FBC5